MRLAGSSPRVPTCRSLSLPRQDSSLLPLGGSILVLSTPGVMACKEARGRHSTGRKAPCCPTPPPPAVHTPEGALPSLCTLRVCSSLFFQGNPSLSSRCGRVVSVLKETPYPWGPDHALDKFLSQGALTAPSALPGQASLPSESVLLPTPDSASLQREISHRTAESAWGPPLSAHPLCVCAHQGGPGQRHPTPREEESPAPLT